MTSATPLHEAREADDDLKARRARIGFWTTCGATTAGFVMLTVGAFAYSGYCPEGDCIADRYAPVVANASALFLTGAVGMLTSGIIMARRKRQRGRDQHRVAAGGRRRVRWDLEKSSAVF